MFVLRAHSRCHAWGDICYSYSLAVSFIVTSAPNGTGLDWAEPNWFHRTGPDPTRSTWNRNRMWLGQYRTGLYFRDRDRTIAHTWPGQTQFGFAPFRSRYLFDRFVPFRTVPFVLLSVASTSTRACSLSPASFCSCDLSHFICSTRIYTFISSHLRLGLRFSSKSIEFNHLYMYMYLILTKRIPGLSCPAAPRSALAWPALPSPAHHAWDTFYVSSLHTRIHVLPSTYMDMDMYVTLDACRNQ